MFSAPWHPGEPLLALVGFGLPALGFLLVALSARSMSRIMQRVEHPDEPMPRGWRYRRGLTDFVEDVGQQIRYFRRYGFDANILAQLGGVVCILAGLVLLGNIEAVQDYLGWRCGATSTWC